MAELMTADKKRTLVTTLIDDLKPRFAQMLPRHIKPERVAAVALTAIMRNADLLELVARGGASRASLASALLDCARLGVMPDNVEAALVTFKDQVQCMLMYRGRLTLARRSKEIKTVEARVVHAKDRYHFTYGFKPRLDHEPTDDADPGPVVAVYAIATLMNGGTQFDWLWKREVDAVRVRSKAANNGPWVTDYEEMAKKTALHRLCKLLPYATEIAGLIDRVESEEPAEPIDLQPMPDDGAGTMAVAIPRKDRLTQFTEGFGAGAHATVDSLGQNAPGTDASSPSQPGTAAPSQNVTHGASERGPDMPAASVQESPDTQTGSAPRGEPKKRRGRPRKSHLDLPQAPTLGGIARLTGDGNLSSEAKLVVIQEALVGVKAVEALDELEASLYDPERNIWMSLDREYQNAVNVALRVKREQLTAPVA